MINFFKNLFGSKTETTPEAAPYKVEEPAPAVTPVAEQATQAVVESIAPAPKKAPAKKAPAAKKPRTPKAAK